MPSASRITSTPWNSCTVSVQCNTGQVKGYCSGLPTSDPLKATTYNVLYHLSTAVRATHTHADLDGDCSHTQEPCVRMHPSAPPAPARARVIRQARTADPRARPCPRQAQPRAHAMEPQRQSQRCLHQRPSRPADLKRTLKSLDEIGAEPEVRYLQVVAHVLHICPGRDDWDTLLD